MSRPDRLPVSLSRRHAVSLSQRLPVSKGGGGPYKKEQKAGPQRRQRPIDEATERDRVERRAHRHPAGPPTSGYRSLLGPSPTCRAGQHWKAAAYLRKIEQAQDHGGWTSAERTRLSHLSHTWRRRARKLDARFNLFGTRPGKLSAADQLKVDLAQSRLDALDKHMERRQSRRMKGL